MRFTMYVWILEEAIQGCRRGIFFLINLTYLHDQYLSDFIPDYFEEKKVTGRFLKLKVMFMFITKLPK